MKKLIKNWHGFYHDQCGTSVIELALFLPLGVVVLLGMVDTSLAFAEKLRIEQAAQRAVEKATSYDDASSDYSQLDDEAALVADVELSNVTMDKWLECDGVREEYFDNSCEPGAQISRHISISIDTSYTPLFAYGPLGEMAGVNGDGTISFTSDAAVRIQ